MSAMFEAARSYVEGDDVDVGVEGGLAFWPTLRSPIRSTLWGSGAAGSSRRRRPSTTMPMDADAQRPGTAQRSEPARAESSRTPSSFFWTLAHPRSNGAGCGGCAARGSGPRAPASCGPSSFQRTAGPSTRRRCNRARPASGRGERSSYRRHDDDGADLSPGGLDLRGVPGQEHRSRNGPRRTRRPSRTSSSVARVDPPSASEKWETSDLGLGALRMPEVRHRHAPESDRRPPVGVAS